MSIISSKQAFFFFECLLSNHKPDTYGSSFDDSFLRSHEPGLVNLIFSGYIPEPPVCWASQRPLKSLSSSLYSPPHIILHINHRASFLKAKSYHNTHSLSFSIFSMETHHYGLQSLAGRAVPASPVHLAHSFQYCRLTGLSIFLMPHYTLYHRESAHHPPLLKGSVSYLSCGDSSNITCTISLPQLNKVRCYSSHLLTQFCLCT